MNLRCVIIDDEYLAIRVLEGFCARIPGIEQVASFKDPRQAQSFLRDNRVDLVFLDIQMPHLSGVEMAAEMAKSGQPMVVFTTARHEFAIQAFELEALDYLIKPIAFERFEKTIRRAAEKMATTSPDSPESPELFENELLIRSDHRTIRLPYPEIIFIEGLNEYVKVHTAGKKIITLAALKDLEASLPQERFVRIHRSYIVSIQHIRSWNASVVEMAGGARLPVGRVYKEPFLRLLGQRG